MNKEKIKKVTNKIYNLIHNEQLLESKKLNDPSEYLKLREEMYQQYGRVLASIGAPNSVKRDSFKPGTITKFQELLRQNFRPKRETMIDNLKN
jgi:hypothetical protein